MKVFLSYNKKDKKIAHEISNKLLGQGIDVWLDKWEIFAGESITDKISIGISTVNAFAVILSDNSIGSNWVREELRIALNKRIREPDFIIIPILLSPCEIHEFLRDYKYIDWYNGDPDGITELILSLKKVTRKPPYTNETFHQKCEILRLDYFVEISGKQLADAKFTEYHSIKALMNIDHIDRSIDCDGIISRVSSTGVEIEREKTTSYSEKWKILPKTPINAGELFSYKIEYLIERTFSIGKNVWDYSIQSPTNLLHIEFDFCKSDIKSFYILHRVGMTTYPEPVQFTRVENKIIWEKISPVFKDTYEFHFEIPPT
ncbi:MAG: toll/interleukin-1 receptor domain-containing protein [Ignavibacteriales bacterium]|nr:MAG: toll/interleukin-1 receptor domain-containing protein [Ignavibacteriales bacterium]